MTKKPTKKPILNGGAPKNFIVLVVILVAAIAGMTLLTDYARQTQSLKYSKFLNLVEKDQIKSVFVSGQDLFGELKDGVTRFETTIPQSDSRLWPMLEKHSIEYGFTNPSSQFSWWHLILLLGLILTPLTLWYMFKQSRGSGGGGGGNIFNMGKRRTRYY